MSRGGAQFSAKVQPILQGLENLDGADVPAVLLEGKITDIKPPVLYPARKIRAPLRETKAEHAAIEFSKKIADKFSYSGFFQGVQSGGSIRKYKDKFRVMIGMRTVYDEVDARSKAFYPMELRRMFPKRPRVVHSAVASSVTLASLSDSIKKLQSVKRQRTEDGTLEPSSSSSSGLRLDDIVSTLAATASSSLLPGEDVTSTPRPGAQEEKVKGGVDAAKGAEEEKGSDAEEEDEDEDEEEVESDNDEEGDDYSAQYGDDDEEGNDAYGDDDDEQAFD